MSVSVRVGVRREGEHECEHECVQGHSPLGKTSRRALANALLTKFNRHGL